MVTTTKMMMDTNIKAERTTTTCRSKAPHTATRVIRNNNIERRITKARMVSVVKRETT